MKDFLITLCSGIRKIPEKYASTFEQLKSCGAIAQTSTHFMLHQRFIIAQVFLSRKSLILKDLAHPKRQPIYLEKYPKHLCHKDIVLVLNIKHPRIIKILSSSKEPKQILIYLEQKKGKIIGITLKDEKKINLPFSQKSLNSLPKNCILSINKNKITKVFGSIFDPSVDEAISLYLGERETDFSDEADALAKSFGSFIDSSLYPYRVDLRGLDFITIDPRDAKDFDDSIYFDERSCTLYIAIADVSEYVTPNTPLDNEAKQRCFSLYFPHKCYPMLPSALSENLCSLRKNKPKLAMVWEVSLHKRTKLPLHSRLLEAIIQTKQNLCYEDVDMFLEGKTLKQTQPFAWLHSLAKITQKFKQKRLEMGFDFYSEEVRLMLNRDQMIKKINIIAPTLAHSLIEECMLLANTLSAQMLQTRLDGLGIYRVHNAPTKDRIFMLFNRLQELGLHIPSDRNFHTQIQHIQAQAKDPAQRKEIDKLIIKSQQEAYYSHSQSPHFGIGAQAYTHFTSPIRRYSDILAHRLLKILIRHQSLDSKIHRQIAFILESIQTLIPIVNDKERQITKTELDFQDRKYARRALELIGQRFEVRIIDSRSPTIGVIISKAILGARVFVVDSRIELEEHNIYKAQIISANLANARIYAKI